MLKVGFLVSFACGTSCLGAFNSSCQSESCDSSLGLKCEEKTNHCVCKWWGASWDPLKSRCYSDQDCRDIGASYYEEDKKRCVLSYATRCDKPESPFQCLDNMDCINHFRGDGKTCRCTTNHTYDNSGYGRGRCLIPLYHGADCAGKERDCAPESGLRCSYKKKACECDSESFWPSDGYNYRCKSKFGGKCQDSWDCGDNMFCHKPLSPYDRNKCVCNYSNFHPTKDGNACVGSYGADCRGSNKNCEAGFICVGSQCKCPNEPDQVYYSKNNTCLTIS